MTDLKTVREAFELILEVSKNRSGDYADCIKELASGSLSALDRIETVETVTAAELLSELKAVGYTDLMALNYLGNKYPNGLRIVKEK